MRPSWKKEQTVTWFSVEYLGLNWKCVCVLVMRICVHNDEVYALFASQMRTECIHRDANKPLHHTHTHTRNHLNRMQRSCARHTYPHGGEGPEKRSITHLSLVMWTGRTMKISIGHSLHDSYTHAYWVCLSELITTAVLLHSREKASLYNKWRRGYLSLCTLTQAI